MTGGSSPSGDPSPWSTERGNLPWDDPGFSRRILSEHLSQAHDAASRRFAYIDRQVSWIHDTLLRGAPTRILDLGCGPGLYAERLSRLGHTCHGIDIGPASIEHARATAERDGLACTYTLGDLRTVSLDDTSEGFGRVTFMYGESSTFSPAQLASILTRAAGVLTSRGLLLMEPHTGHGISAIGAEPSTERWQERGLFLDAPHALSTEGWFDPETNVATRRWVVTPEACTPAEYRVWYQGYSDTALSALLAECEFDADSVEIRPNLIDPIHLPILQLVAAQRL